MTDQPDQLDQLDPERGRSPRRAMCAAVLSLEAITLGLTTPVMITMSDIRPAVALSVGLGLAAACILLAGMLRKESAYFLGHLIQVAAVLLGLVVPVMWALGAIFALLWATAYGLGRKIEREREAAFADFDRRRESGA
ncbi:DUF4233 domain-containing protein [Nocardioides sp. Root190]|uniref:DUF4233 domain-containing protein n=1 Tax=Nocardioides sp. Root190 TaxID=1736488 RepID=UPI000AD11179|nr:DUF4233 domain-containing protein [Nocardioides sp. Root190]